MALPEMLRGRLRLPLICSPMFLISGLELVLAQCRAGVVGTFPTLNARSTAELGQWLDRIGSELAAWNSSHPQQPAAPYGVNLILHRSNNRQQADLEQVVAYRVPLVITSVGRPDRVVESVRDYGGMVLHDVVSVAHARKAVECGVDGLILVCAGAGGHGGTLSPFALVAEVREFWSGPLVLAGAMSNGQALRAAEVMGADLGYMGTRFIATSEACAPEAHKQMILRDGADDILYTPAFSGIWANYLRGSVLAAGVDPMALSGQQSGGGDDLFAGLDSKPKAWRDIWSAGQGIGGINDAPSVAELIERMCREYEQALKLPAWPVSERSSNPVSCSGGVRS